MGCGDYSSTEECNHAANDAVHHLQCCEDGADHDHDKRHHGMREHVHHVGDCNEHNDDGEERGYF